MQNTAPLQSSIPVVDLFAGPGGLSEGFSSLNGRSGQRLFDIRLSIEKDPVAHRTLSLRALYRAFPKDRVPDAYYDYIKGHVSRSDLFKHPTIRHETSKVLAEARCATLGETSATTIDGWVAKAISNCDPWVLVGGPPCQAYSLAGRSRMRSVDPTAFEKDKRHLLYKEYLRIIQKFQPTAFIMENVKGLLSSTHRGSPLFTQILGDLSNPSMDLEYEIRSFVVDKDAGSLQPSDLIIEAEKYGVPQMRHRVIVLGVRRDLCSLNHTVLSPAEATCTVNAVLDGMPKIRSRLSREPDSFNAWLAVLSGTLGTLKGWRSNKRSAIEAQILHALSGATSVKDTGSTFNEHGLHERSGPLHSWLRDKKIGGICQHESRQHMRTDLHRYLFAACYARQFGISPRIEDFPAKLLPAHKNIGLDEIPFKDRFRVQIGGAPATTVVSHIAKDGHYYIHPDPAQCRSLTVREAARLQTFPDNYHFEGNRTEQYAQVGNAVPPWLAKQLAETVYKLLTAHHARTSDQIARHGTIRPRSTLKECA